MKIGKGVKLPTIYKLKRELHGVTEKNEQSYPYNEGVFSRHPESSSFFMSPFPKLLEFR